jgi:hypothetical protein
MRASDHWPWLFPATYALHFAEEYAGGFNRWLSAIAGANLSDRDFIAINAIAFVVMSLAAALAAYQPQSRWLIAALGTIVALNALLHVGGSILARSYSPGAITGALLWFPLGLFALRRARNELPSSSFALGVIVGLCLHGLVSLAALTS